MDAGKVNKVIKYRCPACNEIVETMEAALCHCPSSDGGSNAGAGLVGGPGMATDTATAAGSGAPGADPIAGGSPTTDVPKGTEVIAYDEKGQPSIIRQIDDETGSKRTIVKNEDGTRSIFGESTVMSLANSNEDKTEKWAAALTPHQLRGLVHEVGQRLLEASRLYHKRLKKLEDAAEQFNYSYFGLSPDATEKDLDMAYRKMARKMHPDKNGGTEEAKKKFQGMKERYESLKKKWSSGDAAKDDPESDQPEKKEPADAGDAEAADTAGAQDKEPADEAARADTAEDGEGSNDDGAEKADEKGKAKQKGKKGVKIEYDPKDKESMVETVTNMAKQLKLIDTQMQALVKELERASVPLSEDA